MSRPRFEVAEIFRQHGPDYRAKHALPYEQLRLMRAIEICRSAELGIHREECDQCHYQRFAYGSCRNRHCPKCQNSERARWLDARRDELLPVEYFHVVFTLPAQIARLALANKAAVYSILFRTAAQTLLTIGRDPKHLGAALGFFALLHSWGQNLLFHPHLHCVVPGGGFSPGRQGFLPCRPGFFLPVRVLSRLFRRLFLSALEEAFQQGKLGFPGKLAALAEPAAFAAYLAPLRKIKWVVYAKPPFGGPQQVLDYLGRYTHRVALSNERIQGFDNGQVRFQWKDYRRKPSQQSRLMTLQVEEFIRRFLLHSLPPGLQRIRYYGFLANRGRRANLELCRQLLAQAAREAAAAQAPTAAGLLPPAQQCQALGQAPQSEALAPAPQPQALAARPPERCPQCQQGHMIRLGFLPPGYPLPPGRWLGPGPAPPPGGCLPPPDT
jgi:predicted Zn-ribbon and HTH transcriptional regulator